MKTLIVVAAAAAALAACGPKSDKTAVDNAAGPVVAASETPRNAAVDTTPTTGETTQTPGANSFTEDQARAAIEKAGYGSVGALTQTAEGLWQGMGTKGGKQVTVSVDYKGAVAPV